MALLVQPCIAAYSPRSALRLGWNGGDRRAGAHTQGEHRAGKRRHCWPGGLGAAPGRQSCPDAATVRPGGAARVPCAFRNACPQTFIKPSELHARKGLFVLNSFEEKLVTFVGERTGLGKAKLTAETPLFSGGLLDSMAVLEVTAFVEREVGVRFTTADINLESLDSIQRILRFVQQRQARAHGA
jgi:acyl carrier protein